MTIKERNSDRFEDLPTISMQSVLHLIKERNPVELFDLQTAIWGYSKLRRSTTFRFRSRSVSTMLDDSFFNVHNTVCP